MKDYDSGMSMGDRILETAVRMINDEGGIHKVNMRSIAKAAGCAHTNVYNYFESFEKLLWTAFERIVGKWVDYTKERLGETGNSKKLFAKFITTQIDFALANSGWYRFIWLEPLTGNPPESVKDSFHSMQSNFASLINSASGGVCSKIQAEKYEEIIHGYLHGELCKFINGRYFITEIEYHKNRILTNCLVLLNSIDTSTDTVSP